MRAHTPRIVLAVLAAVLIIRIGAAILFADRQFVGDSKEYHDYAVTILEKKDWLTNTDFPGSWREPGYPLFLALVYSIFGADDQLPVYLIQALLSGLTCLYIYRLGKKVFNHVIAVVALAWASLYPFYLIYLRSLHRDTLVFFLFIVFFYCLYSHIFENREGYRGLWFSAIIYALLVHTDTRYLFYFPFLAFLFFYYQPGAKGVIRYSLFAGAVVLLAIPWLLRNYVAYDRPILITPQTTTYLKYSILPEITNNALGLKRDREIWNSEYPTEEERESIKKGIVPKNRSEAEVEAIRKDVFPADTTPRKLLANFVELWRPIKLSSSYTPLPVAQFFGRWSLRHNLISLLSYGILLPFMILGMFFLIKNRVKAAVFLLFPIFIQSLLHLFQMGIYRYRVPIDGFIMLIAFYGMFQIRPLNRIETEFLKNS